MTRTRYVLAALALAGAFASHAEARFGNQAPTPPSNFQSRFGNQTPITPGNTQPLFGNQVNRNQTTNTQMDDHHDSDRGRRDRRELAEKQRIQTEVTSLETRALLLVEKLQMLTTAKGDPREIARLTEEIRHLGNRIGMLQREEKAPT